MSNKLELAEKFISWTSIESNERDILSRVVGGKVSVQQRTAIPAT